MQDRKRRVLGTSLGFVFAVFFSFAAAGDAFAQKASQKSPQKASKARAKEAAPPFSWKKVYADLKSQGFDPEFLKAIHGSLDRDQIERILRGNVLSFLTPIDHTLQVTPESVEKSKSFCDEHEKALSTAKRLYEVPPSAICSLLYMETRHGRIVGRYNVATVYLALYAGKYPESKRWMREFVKKGRYPSSVTVNVNERIKTRSQTKSDWALGELQALQKIHLSGAKEVVTLIGSVSGAFGIPQFIPSSYLNFAHQPENGGHADLFQPKDAILSVARYLNVHGWSKGEEGPKKALFAYNRSRDYGEAILTISERIASNSP